MLFKVIETTFVVKVAVKMLFVMLLLIVFSKVKDIVVFVVTLSVAAQETMDSEINIDSTECRLGITLCRLPPP